MRTRIRLAICGILFITAIFLATTTVMSFGSVAVAEPITRQYGDANYVLGEMEGKIAVFRGGSATPQTVTDIELSSLREADVEDIRNGIEVESFEELLTLLEDFGS